MSTLVFQVVVVLLLGSLIVDHISAAHIGKLNKDAKLKLLQRSTNGDVEKQASSQRNVRSHATVNQKHHSNSIRSKSEGDVATSKRQFHFPGFAEFGAGFPVAPSQFETNQFETNQFETNQFETNLLDINPHEKPPSSVEDNVIPHFLFDDEDITVSGDGSGSGSGSGSM
jgi:hypothetical protein